MKKNLGLVLILMIGLTLLTACADTGAPAPSESVEPASSADHPNCKGNVTEYGWADAFAAQDPAMFAPLFHESISQGAGTTPSVTFGAETVSNIFGWASKFYQYCDFTYQAVSGNRTFLEWELMTNNEMYMTGMTILTKDADGKVVSAINGHRNLLEVMIFLEHFYEGPEGVGTVQYVHQAALEQYGLEAKYVRKPDGVLKVQGVDDAYIDAFAIGTAESFKEIFAEDVTLSGGYMVETLQGKENVANCLESVANFYEHCIFTFQAEYDNRIYLQYEGRLANEFPIGDGFIVLVRDDTGKIIEVMDNPLPLTANTILSAYLREATKGVVPEKYFYHEGLFAESVEKYGLENVYGENTRKLN